MPQETTNQVSEGPSLVTACFIPRNEPIPGCPMACTIRVTCVSWAVPVAYKVTEDVVCTNIKAASTNCGILPNINSSQDAVFELQVQDGALLSFFIKAMSWPKDQTTFYPVLFDELETNSPNMQVISLGMRNLQYPHLQLPALIAVPINANVQKPSEVEDQRSSQRMPIDTGTDNLLLEDVNDTTPTPIQIQDTKWGPGSEPVQYVYVNPSVLYFRNPSDLERKYGFSIIQADPFTHKRRTFEEFSQADSSCSLIVTNTAKENLQFHISAATEFWEKFRCSEKNGRIDAGESAEIRMTANNLYALQQACFSSDYFTDDSLFFRLFVRPREDQFCPGYPNQVCNHAEHKEQIVTIQVNMEGQSQQQKCSDPVMSYNDYYAYAQPVPHSQSPREWDEQTEGKHRQPMQAQHTPVQQQDTCFIRGNLATSLEVMQEVEEAMVQLIASYQNNNMANLPMGLHNIGNTCFMNAVLQCLHATKGLTQHFILSSPMPKFVQDLKLGTCKRYHGIMASNFAALTTVLSSKQAASLKPYRFRQAVMKSTGDFREYVEHDAQEFLGAVIDTLHEDLNTGDPNFKIPEQNNVDLDAAGLEQAAEKAWQDYSKKTWSKIYQLFTGQMISTMGCLSCGAKSTTFDIFTQVAAEIPEDVQILTDCLECHFIEETLAEPQWDCPKCKVKRRATKEMNLWRLPPYFVIQLKRFEPIDGVYAKNNSSIQCPLILKTKHLADFMHSSSGDFGDLLYELYACVHHVGDLQAGHYTATARHDNIWYNLDDDKVAPADPALYDKHLHGNTAYLLFYERVYK